MTDLKTELTSLKSRIAEIERQIEEQGEWPRIGNNVYFSTPDGNYFILPWESLSWERQALAQGNIHRTREEAELKAKRDRVMARLMVLNGGFKPDLEDTAQEVFFIQWFKLRKCFNVQGRWNFTLFPGSIPFRTIEEAEAAIKELGDDLKVLL